MATQSSRKHASMEGSNDMTMIKLNGNRGNEDDVIAHELHGLTDDLAQRHLFLDLGNVPYLASAELGSLVKLQKKLKACGGRLTLTNVRPEIYEIFVITNLHKVMDVREKLDRTGLKPADETP